MTFVLLHTWHPFFGRGDEGLFHYDDCCFVSESYLYACFNNWYVSIVVFPILKQNLMQNALFGTFTHRKNRYDINTRVTSATYYSQLSNHSHLQLVSWVAKTCTNMSRMVANTSHPVNNHYNSNPDTFWRNHLYTSHVCSSVWVLRSRPASLIHYINIVSCAHFFLSTALEL